MPRCGLEHIRQIIQAHGDVSRAQIQKNVWVEKHARTDGKALLGNVKTDTILRTVKSVYLAQENSIGAYIALLVILYTGVASLYNLLSEEFADDSETDKEDEDTVAITIIQASKGNKDDSETDKEDEDTAS